MGNHLPRLGQIQHGAIKASGVRELDAGVGVTNVYVEARNGIVAEKRRHVLLGAGGKVFAQLVAHDACPEPQHRHRHRSRANA